MAFGFFTVPIQNSASAQEERTAFLRSHKILSVDRRWVEQGASSFWTGTTTTASALPELRAAGGSYTGRNRPLSRCARAFVRADKRTVGNPPFVAGVNAPGGRFAFLRQLDSEPPEKLE